MPTEKEVQKYALTMMGDVDHNDSNTADFHEFTLWIENQLDLQDFLLKYMGVPTFTSIHYRYITLKQEYEKLFIESARSKYSLISEKSDLFFAI